jgi:hypothetical protein
MYVIKLLQHAHNRQHRVATSIFQSTTHRLLLAFLFVPMLLFSSPFVDYLFSLVACLFLRHLIGATKQITQHQLVPVHQVLKPNEKLELLKRYWSTSYSRPNFHSTHSSQ